MLPADKSPYRQRHSRVAAFAYLLGISLLAFSIGAQETEREQIVSENPVPATIVIGFLGGRVKATNFIHKEATLARDLEQKSPHSLTVLTFANHDGDLAMKAVNNLLDTDKDGRLSEQEKSNARIVIYGHSWGASETINMARHLGRMGIPVMLTIQVDSIQKVGEDDHFIPPNVHEAINFYQTQGLLHGRPRIEAVNPATTHILGNYLWDYRKTPVSTQEFPWFARTFMHSHIEIENDPRVWDKVEEIIEAHVF